eukprot:1146793-Pelagomonas_calceolata.AAC.9
MQRSRRAGGTVEHPSHFCAPTCKFALHEHNGVGPRSQLQGKGGNSQREGEGGSAMSHSSLHTSREIGVCNDDFKPSFDYDD